MNDLGSDFQSFAQNYTGPTLSDFQKAGPLKGGTLAKAAPKVAAVPKQSFIGGLIHSVTNPLMQANNTLQTAQSAVGDLGKTALAKATGNKAAQTSDEQKFTQDLNKNSKNSFVQGAKDPILTGKASLGQVAGRATAAGSELAPYFVPGGEELGAGGKILGQAVGNAGLGAIRSAAQQYDATGHINAGQVAKDAAISGAVGGVATAGTSALGGVLNKLSGGAGSVAADEGANAAETASKPGFFDKTANSLDRSVLNPKVSASSFVKGEGDQPLLDYMQSNGLLKPGDNARSMLEKIAPHYQQLQSQINSNLVGDTTTHSAEDLATQAEDAVNNSNRFGGTDTAAQNAIQNTRNILKGAADENGNISSAQLYGLKNEVQGELGKAFDKIDRGGAPSANEDALMAVRDTLNKNLPDSVRDLSQGQSVLHDVAPGLMAKSNEPLNFRPGALLPGFRVPSQGAANLLQSAKTGIAGGLRSVAGQGTQTAASSAPTGLQSLLGGLGSLVGKTAGPVAAFAGQTATNPSNTTSSQAGNSELKGLDVDSLNQLASQVTHPEATSTYNGPSSADIQKVMEADELTNGGKNVSKLQSLYTIAKQQEAAAKAPAATATESKFADTLNQAQSGLSDISKAFEGTNETGSGKLSSLLGAKPLGLGIPGAGGVRNVNQSVEESLPALMSALGYTNTKDNETTVRGMLPNAEDTKSSAATKINKVLQALQQKASGFIGDRS